MTGSLIRARSDSRDLASAKLSQPHSQAIPSVLSEAIPPLCRDRESFRASEKIGEKRIIEIRLARTVRCQGCRAIVKETVRGTTAYGRVIQVNPYTRICSSFVTSICNRNTRRPIASNESDKLPPRFTSYNPGAKRAGLRWQAQGISRVHPPSRPVTSAVSSPLLCHTRIQFLLNLFLNAFDMFDGAIQRDASNRALFALQLLERQACLPG